ncbi:MAG: molybdopterin-binding protein [Alphaproteobacteria bacterium]|nr:molybdopterin-binding protein [Alphaproteobacteria bacterium]
MPKTVTAALIIIGNEILSGRTRDENLPYLAEQLNEAGVRLTEARVVTDDEAEIVAAVNECRARFDYVFTTGGIGPTHDDITSDSIAAAFGVPIDYHPEALAKMEAHYQRTGAEFNEARKRMARVPHGGVLVENPISTAPGYRIENVFVLAGVPVVMRAMFQSLRHQLDGGAPVRSASLAAHLSEGQIAGGLAQLQARYPDIDIGSYPFYRGKRYGTSIVCRSADEDELAAAVAELRELMIGLGGEPIEEEATDPA